jgi:pseudouridine kinase
MTSDCAALLPGPSRDEDREVFAFHRDVLSFRGVCRAGFLPRTEPGVGQSGLTAEEMGVGMDALGSVAPAGVRVVVVGGANTDIVGASSATLRSNDSNPGHIRVSSGGVGRNIAENLARLRVRVSLITAFGGDEAGGALMKACGVAGIDVSASIVADDLPGAHYLAILDERCDMVLAVNDMRVLDLVTPEALAEPARAALLAGADLVVVDTNLPAASLEWLAANLTAPIVLEPVSEAKAGRASGILSRVAALTPNAAEAAALLGHEVAGLEAALDAARELVTLGVGAAFVTCGVDGTAWAEASASGTIPAPRVKVANASGAGDAFCAGVAWAMAAGRGAGDAAILGTALASIALGDQDTVSRRVTPEAASAAAKELD